MRKIINTILLVVGLAVGTVAQEKVEVKGVVTDDKGLKIEHATVVVKDIANSREIPIKADDHGQYSVPIKAGKYVFKFQAPGYATKTVIAEISGFTILDIDLVKIQNSKTSRL